MDFHFNGNIADEVGVNGALIIQNFAFWLMKNKANNRHFYDGDYWTYNTMEAFTTQFTYWNARQVRTILENLRKNGYIKVGNYNKKGYDRTLWYTFTDKGYALVEKYLFIDLKASNSVICQKSQMEMTKKSNGYDEKVKPIPDINTDIKTNIYIDVINYLNFKANKRYSPTTSKTRSLIDARVKEKFTLEDFKTVIDIKCSQWLDSEYSKYLRPETLFGTKFEGYLNETPVKEDKKNSINFEDYIV